MYPKFWSIHVQMFIYVLHNASEMCVSDLVLRFSISLDQIQVWDVYFGKHQDIMKNHSQSDNTSVFTLDIKKVYWGMEDK